MYSLHVFIVFIAEYISIQTQLQFPYSSLFNPATQKKKMPKIAFQKVTSSPLPGLGHCTAKNRDIALKLCMSVVCMYLNNRHAVLGYVENFEFYR